MTRAQIYIFITIYVFTYITRGFGLRKLPIFQRDAIKDKQHGHATFQWNNWAWTKEGTQVAQPNIFKELFNEDEINIGLETWSSMYSGALIYPSKLNITYYYSRYLILSINNFKIPSIKTGLNSIADGSSERRGILHFSFSKSKELVPAL